MGPPFPTGAWVGVRCPSALRELCAAASFPPLEAGGVEPATSVGAEEITLVRELIRSFLFTSSCFVIRPPADRLSPRDARCRELCHPASHRPIKSNFRASSDNRAFSTRYRVRPTRQAAECKTDRHRRGNRLAIDSGDAARQHRRSNQHDRERANERASLRDHQDRP